METGTALTGEVTRLKDQNCGTATQPRVESAQNPPKRGMKPIKNQTVKELTERLNGCYFQLCESLKLLLQPALCCNSQVERKTGMGTRWLRGLDCFAVNKYPWFPTLAVASEGFF